MWGRMNSFVWSMCERDFVVVVMVIVMIGRCRQYDIVVSVQVSVGSSLASGSAESMWVSKGIDF